MRKNRDTNNYFKTWKIGLLMLLMMASTFEGLAQTTLCAPLITTNSNGKVTFNFRNNNAFAVIITDIQAQGSATVASNTEAWYRPTALAYPNAASFPILTTANWTQFGNSTANMVLNTNTSLFGGSLNLTIPAGATYGFCISVCQTASPTLGSLRYSSLVAGTSYAYPDGGCEILSGGPAATNASAAGAPRLGSTSFANVPRGFLGCVVFQAAVPCAGTPAPGNTVSSANPTCSGSSFNLSLQNSTGGTGVTYQWQSADDNAFTVNLANLGTSSVQTTSQTSAKYYRCQVTCAGNTGTSNPLLVSMQSGYPCYCPSTFPSAIEPITLVNFAGINNSSSNVVGGTPATQNFTAITGTVTQGQSHAFVAKGNTDGAFANFFRVYIDFNQNGSWADAGESFDMGSITGSTGLDAMQVSGNIAIPPSAPLGITYMRVLKLYNAYPASPCNSAGFGQAEDYTINVIAAAPCSGIPTAGTVISNINAYGSVCSGANFTLSLNGTSSGSGLTYQWQSSPDNIVAYTDVSGATNATLTTNISSTTWYRCVVTCSGQDGISSVYQVKVSTVACYCLGTYTNAGGGGGDFGLNIINVNVGGINNTSSAQLTLPNVYTDFTYISGSVQQSNSYPISISRSYTGNTVYWGVWVDWDNSGTFTNNANEYMSLTALGVTGGTGASTGSGTLVVPAGATLGPHIMRIRANFSVDPGQASICNLYTYGETEDYILNVVGPCAGTPVAGSTASLSAMACPTIPFSLYLTGVGAALNLTYQWQTSPDNIAPYTDIVGATNPTTTQSQTSSAYYRCMITCTNSGLSASSTPLQMNMDTYANCICVLPNYSANSVGGCTGTTANDYIGQVTFAGINNTTGCGATGTGYQYFPSQIALVNQTVTYPITVSAPPAGAAFQRFKVYIDFNDNASCDDPGEMVYNSGPISTASNTTSGFISIAANAPLGTHRLRVRSTNPLSSNLDANSCSDDGYYGEVEEYQITISGPPPCTGTPTPGQTLASTPLACASTSISLGLELATSGAGVTYQWQSSLNAAFTSPLNLGTATTQTVTQAATTWYRCIVTCSGADGISVPVMVSSSGPCYCTSPAHGSNGCTLGLYINNFTFANINNTSGCYSSVPYTTPYYNYFPTAIANVSRGVTYNYSITTPVGPAAYTQFFGIWIDFNDNGSFDDANEFIANTTTATDVNTWSGTYMIPVTAPVGAHKMRIRSGNAVPTSSCSAANSGETEDYIINIACEATAGTSGTVCEGGALNLTSSYLGSGSVVSYSWTTTAANGFTSGIQNPSISPVTASDAGDYTVTITDDAGCVAVKTTTVTISPVPDLSTSGGGAACAGNGITLSVSNNAAGQSSGNSYSWTTDASIPFTSTQQTPNVTGSSAAGHAGNYTVVVTNSFLCTASAIEAVTVNPNPTLSVVSTQNVGCVGGSDGVITVSGSNGTPNYDYSADGFTTQNNTGVMTNLPTGPTTIVVLDANGCTGSITQSLTAISTVPPSAAVVVPFIGMPTNVCNGTTATLSIPSVSNTTMYIWDAPAGAYFNGNVLNVSPFTTTTPTVTVTYGNPSGSLYVTGVQAANGCGQSLRKIQKTRGTISVPASVSGATTACQNTVGSYSTGAVEAASSYLWTITGDASVSGTGTTATVTFGPAWNGGTLCVAAQTSCYTSAAKCIAISKNASLLNAISGSFTACPNSVLAYSVPASTGAASYTWTAPSGASVTSGAGTNSVSVTYSPGYSSAGSICVSVTSVCGVTSAIKCKTVAPGLPTVPSSISGALSGLCNQPIAYNCPSQGVGTTYTWTAPAGATITGQGSTSISVQYSSFTTGNVCVVANNSCGSSSARCVPVKGAPNAAGAITANPGSWCAGDQVEFTVNTSALTGSYTRSWSYPGPSVVTYVIGGGNSNSLTLDWITGTGNINVTTSNACGSATKTSTWSSTCRHGELATVSALTVSPNPTTDVLNVSYNATKGHTEITVLDLAGRVVLTQNSTSVEGINNTQITMSGLAKGAYLLQVQSTQGTKQVRVVVE